MEIKSTLNSLENKIKMVIYGPPGIGKTTQASNLKNLKKVLFVSFEAGTGSISGYDIPMIDVTIDEKTGKPVKPKERLKSLEDVYKYLLTDEAKKKFDTIFIDSLSEIAECVVESLQQNPEYSDPSKALKLWGQYSKEMKALIKLFRDLPNYNVIFTSLLDVEKDEAGNFKKGLSLPGKISQKAPQYFDEVLMMDIIKDKEGKEHRVFLTEATHSATAKDRSGNLDKYEKADLGNVIEKIKTTTKKGEK